MIELKSISFSLGGAKVINSLSLNIEDGEIVALVGRSGSGKTALLRAIFSSSGRYDGSILIDGRESRIIKKSDRIKLVSGSLGDLPENSEESVYGFVNIGTILFSGADREERGTDLVVERFGLDECADSRLGELPEGTLKKAILAHTFAKNSKHMLLDNPQAGLDIASIQTVQKAISLYSMNGDASVVFATSDLNFAFQTADRVLAIENGRDVIELNSGNVTQEMIKKIFGAETLISRNVYNGKVEVHNPGF